MTRQALAIAIGLLVACAAEAQPRQTNPYDFDDTAVEGELARPDLERIAPPPRPAREDAGCSESELDDVAAAADEREPTPAMLLRLADVATACATRRFGDAFRAMDAAHAAGEDASVRAIAERRERAARAEARRHAERALSLLGRIAEDAGPRLRARALSREIHVLGLLDRGDEGTAKARTLVGVCPRCREAAGAHLRVADAAFLQADLARAIDHYGDVLAVPGAAPGERAYARYKRGWAHLNLGAFDAAWSDLDAARREAASDGAPSRALAREATKDLVRVLALLDVDAATALARLEYLAPDRRARADLADRYETQLRDHGRTSDADAFAAARHPPAERPRD